MIAPTDEDVGRRVRWQGRNPFGLLKSFNDTHGVVLFDYEHVTHEPIALTELFWAGDDIGRMQTGEKPLDRNPRSAFRNFPPGRWDE